MYSFREPALTQPRSHGHHKKCEAADPNDGREQMKPMIDDGNELIEIKEKCFVRNPWSIGGERATMAVRWLQSLRQAGPYPSLAYQS